MTTLSLAAIGCFCGESCIALSADHLFAFVLSRKSGERGLNFDGSETTTTETQNEMESRFLLDVIVL